MQCLQCGKFFVEHDVTEKYCSIECFTRAQLDSIHFCSPIHFKIYCNDEEVKRIDEPEIKKTVRD